MSLTSAVLDQFIHSVLESQVRNFHCVGTVGTFCLEVTCLLRVGVLEP